MIHRRLFTTEYPKTQLFFENLAPERHDVFVNFKLLFIGANLSQRALLVEKGSEKGPKKGRKRAEEGLVFSTRS